MAGVSRLSRWERRSEWPLAGAAVLFLVAYGAPIVQPGLGDGARALCGAVVVVTWAAFGVDYAVRLGLAERRAQFVRRNLLDLAILVLPVLRPLRLLRLVVLLSVLNRAGAHRLRGRVVTYVTAGTLLLLVCGALAVTDAERGRPGATITGFGDGLWWAVTTMTTVGYGDRYPVTSTGRFVAVALMIGGIALLGVVTATLASWMVDRVADENEVGDQRTRSQVDVLTAEVRALRAELRLARGEAAASSDPPPSAPAAGPPS
jgi:voltage-gated potassium channel